MIRVTSEARPFRAGRILSKILLPAFTPAANGRDADPASTVELTTLP